jgi:phage/plasmid-associated DNA primase
MVPTYKVNYGSTRKIRNEIGVIGALLLQDFQYHERLEKDDLLKLFADVDKMLKYNKELTIEKVIDDVCDYIKCSKHEISWTANYSVQDGSYHLVVPKYYMKSSLQKKFWKEFQIKYNYSNEIDVGVFDKRGWFRLPNQTKEGAKDTEHVIQQGAIEDFVLKFIDNAVEYDYIHTTNAVEYNGASTNVKPSAVKAKKELNQPAPLDNNIHDTDKFLNLLFNVIGNGKDENNNKLISWDNWFKICGILKSNKYSYDVFKLYSEPCGDEAATLNLWKSSNNPNMSIHGLQTIAKEINPAGYTEWKRKHYMKLYNELFTSGLIAEYFSNLYGHLFIYSNEVLYFYTGCYWRPDDKNSSRLVKFIDKEFYDHLLKKVSSDLRYKTGQLNGTDDEKERDGYQKEIESISKLLTSITTIKKHSVRKDIVKDIIIQTTNNDIKFDNEPYLYAFKNAIFDLRTGKQIPPNASQYLSITCGCDYDPDYSPELVKELNDIIDSIFPDATVKDYFLHILATGLSGIQLENLFIFTGVGGNGKSLLNSLFLKLLGDYGYKLPKIIIQGEMKVGANPELANLHKKRYVVSQEPDPKKKLSCNAIKEITGDKTINARQLYCGDTKTELTLTLCIECNEKPMLDEVIQAIVRRVRVIPFITQSIEKEEYDKLPESERVNINIRNPAYKTDEFQDKYKQAMFAILLDKFKGFYNNNCELPLVPETCAKEARDYMAVSDDLFSWFTEFYEPLSREELGTDVDVPITLTDIYKKFSGGDLYNGLSKSDKRKYNRRGFLEGVEKNIFLRKLIKLRKSTYNGKQLAVDSIVGWKLQTTNVFGMLCEKDINEESFKELN